MRMFGPFFANFRREFVWYEETFSHNTSLKKYRTGKHTGKKLFEESKKLFFVKFTNGTLEEPQKTFTPPQKSFLRFLQRTFGELYEKKSFLLSSKSFLPVFLPLLCFFREDLLVVFRVSCDTRIRCKKKCHLHVFPSIKTDSCVAGCSNYHQKIPPWKNTARVKILVKNFLRRVKNFFLVKFTKGTPYLWWILRKKVFYQYFYPCCIFQGGIFWW